MRLHQVKQSWRLGAGSDAPAHAFVSADGTAIATISAGGTATVFSSSTADKSSAAAPSAGASVLAKGARVTDALHHVPSR